MQGEKSEGRVRKNRRQAVEQEEDRLWAAFYRNRSDAVLATDLIDYFAQDGEARQQHTGLYIHSRQIVRRQKQREVRARRLASALRTGMALAMLPWRVLGRATGFMGHVVLALLPAGGEPAAGQLKKWRQQSVPPSGTKADAAQDGQKQAGTAGP